MSETSQIWKSLQLFYIFQSVFFRVLEVQMRRVKEFESWEESKRKEMFSIRTKASPGIYFLPKEPCEETRAAHDESMEAIEAEIKEMKEKFEEDLLKIEERAKEPRGVSQD